MTSAYLTQLVDRLRGSYHALLAIAAQPELRHRAQDLKNLAPVFWEGAEALAKLTTGKPAVKPPAAQPAGVIDHFVPDEMFANMTDDEIAALLDAEAVNLRETLDGLPAGVADAMRHHFTEHVRRRHALHKEAALRIRALKRPV